MVLMVLFCVAMFLWLVSVLPYPPLAPLAQASGFLAFAAVLILGLVVFRLA